MKKENINYRPIWYSHQCPILLVLRGFEWWSGFFLAFNQQKCWLKCHFMLGAASKSVIPSNPTCRSMVIASSQDGAQLGSILVKGYATIPSYLSALYGVFMKMYIVHVWVHNYFIVQGCGHWSSSEPWHHENWWNNCRGSPIKPHVSDLINSRIVM